MTALERLEQLRQDLYLAIPKAIEDGGGHCKSYEGSFSLTCAWPAYSNRSEAPEWTLTLDLYVIGPSRHYKWRGQSIDVVVERADADVRGWLRDEAQA